MALAGVLAGAAQSDAVVDGAVVSDLTGLTEHDAHAVIDEQASADGGTGVDLDASAAASVLADPAGKEKALMPVQPVRNAVIHQNVKAGYSKMTSSTLRAAGSLRWMFRASSNKPMGKPSLS